MPSILVGQTISKRFLPIVDTRVDHVVVVDPRHGHVNGIGGERLLGRRNRSVRRSAIGLAPDTGVRMVKV